MARTRQPQGVTRPNPYWLSRGLRFLFNPAVSNVNLVSQSQHIQTTGLAKSITDTGVVWAGNSQSEFEPNGLAAAALNLTFVSIWLSAAGEEYSNATGGNGSFISSRTSGNVGWTWGGWTAVAGSGNGNKLSQSLTLHGVAQYAEANSTIESYISSPVACRLVNGSAISWFNFGRKTSADTACGSLGAGSNIVLGDQAPWGTNYQRWRHRGGVIAAFNTALSDAEIWALTNSTQATNNLFAPQRRLWVQLGPAAGGGGTTYNVDYADSKSLTDLYNNLAIFNSAYPETKVLSDAYWGTGTLVGYVSESITLSDIDTGDVGAATYSRDYEEALTLTDNYSSQLVGIATQAEGITLSEAYAGSGIFTVAISESVSLTDTQMQDSAKLGDLTETISLSDSYSTQLIAVSAYSDTIDIQDLYSNQAVFESNITDSSTLLDAYSATVPGGAGDGTLTPETIDLIADEVMSRLYENPVRRM